MPVNVISTIKPKNQGTFPVVEDIDVLIKSSGARLSEVVATMATQEQITALQAAVAGKASQSDLNALSTTVAAKQNALTEAQLTAVNSGITSELVTQIGTNTTAIAGKASQADLTALETEVDSKADASDLTTATANLQSQIDAIVTPVTQDAEVQNARVGADGTTHASLKARIDSEINEFKTNVEQKVNAKELLDGYKYLEDSDFTVGYIRISDGVTTSDIRGIYTDYLPAGYVVDVSSSAVRVAKYSYSDDTDKTFIKGVESVTLPNTVPNSLLCRYLVYWADTGLYTDVTEGRARELLPLVSVKTTTLSDYKGSNPQIDNLYAEKAASATAFVSNRHISWRDDAVCDLLITDNIKLYIGKETLTLTPESLYALANASELVTLRSDNSIRGYDFALCYDMIDEEFEFRTQSYPSTHQGRYIVLFEHYYSSLTGGGLLASSTYSSRIHTLENPVEASIPSYFIDEAAATAASVEAAATEPCYAVIFLTDSHHNNTWNDLYDAWKYTGKNIQYLSTLYQFDAIIHGGDLVSGNISKASTIRLTNEMRNALATANDNLFILMGNHDDNSYKDKTTNYIDASERYGIMHRQSCTKVYTCPDDTASFYYDIPELGLRVICLNSIVGYGVDSNADAWGYSDDTLAWFSGTALDTDNQVAIFSHMCFSGEFNGYNLYPKNGVEMRGAVDAFVASGGTVVALFHGHNHWDNIGQVQDSNLIEVDTACSLCSETTPTVTGATVPTRNLDDVTADCFDCIVIKPASRTVNMIRFGAGDDRSFTY